VQGDIVLECIHISDNLEKEEVMFKVMFNTAFIQSNSLLLNRDELDVAWNSKDQFPRDFRVEVGFPFLILNVKSTLSYFIHLLCVYSCIHIFTFL
jgi:C2 domain of PTEN tumour-suppressor protein